MREPSHNEIVAARRAARIDNDKGPWRNLLDRYPEWNDSGAAGDVWADDSLHYDTPTAPRNGRFTLTIEILPSFGLWGDREVANILDIAAARIRTNANASRVPESFPLRDRHGNTVGRVLWSGQ